MAETETSLGIPYVDENDGDKAAAVNTALDAVDSLLGGAATPDAKASLAGDNIFLGSNAFRKALVLQIEGGRPNPAGINHNYAAGVAPVLRIGESTDASAITLTGLSGGSDGMTKTIANVSGGLMTFANEDGRSLALNRFRLPNGADLVVPSGGSVEFFWDNYSSRWRPKVASLAATETVDGGGEADSGLWNAVQVAAIGAATVLTAAAVGKMHLCTGAGADYTVTLPSAAACANKVLQFQMSGTLTKLVTLASGDAIDGSATRVMWAGESAVLWSDGATWRKIAGKTRPFACRIARNTALDVTGSVATKVSCSTTSSDPSGLMALNGEIKIPRAGVYSLKGLVYYFAVTTAGAYQTRIHKNDFQSTSTICAPVNYVPGGSYPGTIATADEPLIAGDSVILATYHNSNTIQSLYVLEPLNWLSATEIPQW